MTVTCCPLSSSDDGEHASVFTKKTVKAAKPHTCFECREPIPKEARYEWIKGLWSGAWDTYRTCLSCVEIRDHFACEGYVFGQLWEDLAENFFPDMKAGGPCMEGLSPEAKGRLFERRLAWTER